jgi:effector-binding domain-containing protein
VERETGSGRAYQWKSFLEKLKELKKGTLMAEPIETKAVQPQPVVSVRRTVAARDVTSLMDQAFPQIWGFLQKQGIQPLSPPFSRYHHYGTDTLDLEVGLPVTTPISLPEETDMANSELPGGTVATTWHVGPYETLPQTYLALEAWIKKEGREIAGPPWEIYWTDPGQEPDSSKWRTQLLWPIK